MPTLTVTAIRSWPDATHTVQDEVRLVFDRRLLPGDDPAAAFGVIRAAADIGSPWQVETEFGPCMLPAEISPDGRLMGAIAEGCRRQGLEVPQGFFMHGALDAGYLNAHGCESTMWGPGDVELWHSDNEQITAEKLVCGAAGYYGLIEATLF